MKPVLITLFPVAVFLIAACSLFGGEDDVTARISEKGVDGVHFGDSVSHVLEHLGPPDSDGWIDGPYGAWFHFSYGTPQSSLTVAFTIPSGRLDSLSVVDLFGLRSSYSGRTKEGIGIGSTRDEVRQVFGDPKHVEGVNDIRGYYCMGDRDVEFAFRSDTVYAFAFGYQDPPENWYTKCSE